MGEDIDSDQGGVISSVDTSSRSVSEALIYAFSYFLDGEVTIEKIKSHPLNRQQSKQLFYILVDKYGLKDAVDFYQQLANLQRGSVNPEQNSALSIVRIRRDKAKINASNFKDMQLISVTDRALLEQLDGGLDAKGLLSLLTYSAIRYGGLLRKGAINSFINKALSLVKLDSIAGQLWTTIGLTDVSEPQIWLPDPLTKLILSRLNEKSDELACVQAWLSSIERKSLVMTILNSQFDLRISQSRFIKAIANVIRLNCGSGLVEPALSDPFDNRSMKSDVFLRMMTKKSPNLKIMINIETAQKPRFSSQEVIRVAGSGVKDRSVLSEVRALLHPLTFNHEKKLGVKHKTAISEVTSKIESLLDKESARLSPLLVLVVRWSVSRITVRNMWGNRHAPSSAIKRVSQIYNGLVDHLDQINPIALDGDTLQDLYAQAIDVKESNSARLDFTRSLRDFHSYLVEINPLLEIPPGSLWRSSTDIKNDVDANLMWPWEYSKVIESINSEIAITGESISGKEWEERLWKVRRAVMVMGYRCGMRRNEILYLRKSDLAIKHRRGYLPRDQWEIIVSPHAKRALKSSSAYRRIPIGILATEQELDWIEELYQTTGSIDISEQKVWRLVGDRYFCLHESEERRGWEISTTQVFDPITWLMTTITGDKTTRFHHLRHSFATINFWRWMHPAVTAASPFAERFEEPGIDAVKQRRLILGLKTGLEPSKKVLHALSMMMGHSEPKMTLCHYIHSANLLLHQRLRQGLPIFGSSHMSNLLSVGQRSVQLQLKKSGSNNAILAVEGSIDARLPKQYHRSSREWPETQSKRVARYGRDVTAAASSYMDVYIAAYEVLRFIKPSRDNSRTLLTSVRELAMVYEISTEALLRASLRAAHIATITHETGGYKTKRHAPPKEQLKGVNENNQTFLYYPRQKYSRALSQEILERYQDLPEEDKDRIRPFLDFYIAENRVADGWLEFKALDQFRAFQECVSTLNIRRNIVSDTRALHYRYTLRSKYPENSKKFKAEKRYWKQLSLTSPIDLQVRKLGAYKAEHGILEVRPVTVAVDRTQLQLDFDDLGKSVSRGLNFALYVLAVVDSTVKLPQFPKDFLV